MQCPVCSEQMRFAGYGAYSDPNAYIKTPFFDCPSCDLFYRDVSEEQLKSHLAAASYVKQSNESRFWKSRYGFFEYILKIIETYKNTYSGKLSERPVLVDFGSSYGHLIEIAKGHGFDTIGIELNEELLSMSKRKNFEVYHTLSEVPRKADVITAIDSLYYVQNCNSFVQQFRSILKPGGLLVVRVTNRNLYSRILTRIGRDGFAFLGDATISYSKRSMEKLLTSNKFTNIHFISDSGKGKDLLLRKKMKYLLSYFATLLSRGRLILAPGFIVTAEAS